MDLFNKISFWQKTSAISAALFLSILSTSFAQTVSLTASAPRVVYQGEQFRLTYQLNAKAEGFNNPDIKDFNVLSGPNVSTSSSVQIINGKVSQSVQYTYTYILSAPTAGNFTIEPATAKANGQIVKSGPVTVEVVTRGNQPQTNTTQNQQQGTVSSGGKDVFARIITDKKNVYIGEKLTATIIIYTNKNLGGFEDYKFPPFSGFWSHDLEAPTTLNFHNENVDGTIYQAALLKKVLLIPQRSGKITIEPFTASVVIRQQVRSNNPFDDFFGGSYRNIQLDIKSPEVTINVKPLPDNKPESFAGAVGELKMSSTITKTEVTANEAVTLSIRISGQGNLKFIAPLNVAFPPALDVYDPKTSLNIQNTENGMAGNITFDYLFIPRHAGKYRIAPVTFTYFDINDKQYRTYTTPEYNINVARGENTPETASGVVQGLTKEDVKYLGKDVRFIKTGFSLSKKQKYIFGSTVFIVYYITLIIIFILILLIRRVQIIQNANQAKVKNRKANRVSRKRLKQAAVYMKQGKSELFYNEVLKAIWGYLSDKLVIPLASLSKDNVVEILQQHNTDQQNITALMELIDACEFARYAPSSVSGGMDEIYRKSGELISVFDQKIK